LPPADSAAAASGEREARSAMCERAHDPVFPVDRVGAWQQLAKGLAPQNIRSSSSDELVSRESANLGPCCDLESLSRRAASVGGTPRWRKADSNFWSHLERRCGRGEYRKDGGPSSSRGRPGSPQPSDLQHPEWASSRFCGEEPLEQGGGRLPIGPRPACQNYRMSF
jgi:hypothetical protein